LCCLSFASKDLAAQKTYTNLDVTVTEALQYRSGRFSGVASCTRDESLATIMERIVRKEVHRLVVVDAERRVTGIVSLSDILTFIVLHQQSATTTASLTTAFGLTRLSHHLGPSTPR
jgi:predicted transcriptional regulator